MTPNDRRSPRRAVEMDVRLILPDRRSTGTWASNISLDGMYLAPACYPVGPLGLVEISLQLAKRHYRLQAMVVHSCDRGLGLMFRSADEGLYRRAVRLCVSRRRTAETV